MAHINLLPWREERRQERQKQFIMSLVLAFIFAATGLYGVILFADDLIDKQNKRNAFMKKEIAVLDSKIREIKKLEIEKNKLISRMQVIQDLQSSRPKVVKVFDSLVRVIPDGVHLTKLTRQGGKLILNGIAESNARVSVFMRKLDEHLEFDESNLQVVQKGGSVRKFTININESKMKKEEGDE